MRDTNLPPWNWNTIAAIIMMIFATLLICVWAAYDFSQSDRTTTVHISETNGDASSLATKGHSYGLNLGLILQSKPSLPSKKDKTILSVEEIELDMGSVFDQGLERHKAYEIRLPRSRTLTNTTRGDVEEHRGRQRNSLLKVMHERALLQESSRVGRLAPSRDSSPQEQERSVDERTRSHAHGLYRGRPVPGLPHPKKSVLLPPSAQQHARPRRDYAGKGKLRDHSGYVEERDAGLLSQARPPAN